MGGGPKTRRKGEGERKDFNILILFLRLFIYFILLEEIRKGFALLLFSVLEGKVDNGKRVILVRLERGTGVVKAPLQYLLLGEKR